MAKPAKRPSIVSQLQEYTLRNAVYKAIINAEADGQTEAIATTEYCVQFLLRRFPELKASAALSAYRRLRPRE